MKENYVSWIRERVGHDNILLNYVASVIFDEQGRIRLQRRSDSGKWGVPGGVMELHESLNDTLTREVLEETSLLVEPVGILGVYAEPEYRNTYPNGDVCRPIVVVLYGGIVEGELQADGKESLEVGFFSEDNLPPMSSKLHEDIVRDAFLGEMGIYR